MPIHWSKATAFLDTATHAVDFGSGVHMIVIGEKGKGSSELYTCSRVKYESWWSKNFAPKLVKTA
jgi:fatty acid synthase subunit beta